MATISIITATRNCESQLPYLVASLKNQTDQDFEWVVVDGNSSDKTSDVVRKSGLRCVVFNSQPDFSIYDALNRGINIARHDYYLVLGADDTIEATTVERFKAFIDDKLPDIAVASVRGFGRILHPMTGSIARRGGNAIASSHAVGTAIRRDLHQRIGLYSNRYVNGADMYFILLASTTTGVRIEAADFIAGEFGSGGISSVDRMASVSDAFRIQLHFEKRKLRLIFQFCIYIFRTIRIVFFSPR